MLCTRLIAPAAQSEVEWPLERALEIGYKALAELYPKMAFQPNCDALKSFVGAAWGSGRRARKSLWTITRPCGDPAPPFAAPRWRVKPLDMRLSPFVSRQPSLIIAGSL